MVLEAIDIELGRSAGGEFLFTTQIGSGDRPVVVVGGLHAGFAPSSVAFMQQLREHILDNPEDLPPSVTLYLVENANPDSPFDPGEAPGRLNGNGVDLNRNWDCNWSADAIFRGEPIDSGVFPFSEPETSTLRDFFVDIQPEVVVFYEAFARDGIVAAGNCNGATAGSGALADLYADESGYLVNSFILTGDSSDWLVSVGIPSISVLLKDYEVVTSTDWQDNLAGLLAVIDEVK